MCVCSVSLITDTAHYVGFVKQTRFHKNVTSDKTVQMTVKICHQFYSLIAFKTLIKIFNKHWESCGLLVIERAFRLFLESSNLWNRILWVDFKASVTTDSLSRSCYSSSDQLTNFSNLCLSNLSRSALTSKLINILLSRK